MRTAAGSWGATAGIALFTIGLIRGLHPVTIGICVVSIVLGSTVVVWPNQPSIAATAMAGFGATMLWGLFSGLGLLFLPSLAVLAWKFPRGTVPPSV